MSRVTRTILTLAVGGLLLSAMTMAQTAGKNSEKDTNKQQHSRLSKVAFWRHHQNADKNAKPSKASSKPGKATTAQVKPVAAKQVAGKTDPKQEQHASKVTKAATKKAPAASKTKPPQEQDSKAGLLKH